MFSVSLRDLLGLVVAFVVTLAAQCIFVLIPAIVLEQHAPDLYSKIFDDHPVINEATACLLFFVVPAFLAVSAGVLASSAHHRVRNGWLYTVIGVLFDAWFHYETFTPHRETDDSATYVLFTSPEIYLLAAGGACAATFVTFRHRAAAKRER